MTTPQSRVVSAVISLIVGAIVGGTLAGLSTVYEGTGQIGYILGALIGKVANRIIIQRKKLEYGR